MNSIKKFLNFIKKLWSNKKTRSATILFFYLIFIFIMVISIRINSDETPQEDQEIIENLEESSKENNKLKYFENYKYDMEITLDTQEIYKISTNNDESIIKYYIFNQNNNKYDIIEAIPSNIVSLDLEYILYLINSTNEEFTTIYKDGTILNNYNIKLNNKNIVLDVKYNKENYILNIRTKIDSAKYKITFSK